MMIVWLVFIQEPPPHRKFLFAAAAGPCELQELAEDDAQQDTLNTLQHPKPAGSGLKFIPTFGNVWNHNSWKPGGGRKFNPQLSAANSSTQGTSALTFWGVFFCQAWVKGRQSPRVGDCGTFPCLLPAHLGRDRTSFNTSGIYRHSSTPAAINNK